MALTNGNDIVINWPVVPGVSSYKFEILNDLLALVRSGTANTNQIIYKYSEAIADGGIWPELTVKIKALDSEGAESVDWSALLVSAPFSENSTATSAELSAVQAAAASSSHSHTLANIIDSGDSAGKNVGTTAGTVAEGDHTHAVGAPEAHWHTLADISDAGTMASQNTGATGTFESGDAVAKTITVTNGIITSIV